jgi:hypothetical protein
MRSRGEGAQEGEPEPRRRPPGEHAGLHELGNVGSVGEPEGVEGPERAPSTRGRGLHRAEGEVVDDEPGPQRGRDQERSEPGEGPRKAPRGEGRGEASVAPRSAWEA